MTTHDGPVGRSAVTVREISPLRIVRVWGPEEGGGCGPWWWCGATGERARTARSGVMHRLLVPSSPTQDSSAGAEWLAAALQSRRKSPPPESRHPVNSD